MAKKLAKSDTDIMEKDIIEDVVDVEITPVKVKQRFRIDRDNNKIIELDVTDISVVTRLESKIPELSGLADELDAATEDNLSEFVAAMETKVRGIIDYIFDSNVADVICGNASIMAIIDGKFRFEYILETLLGLYGNNISKEADKVKAAHNKYVDKYSN